MPVVATIEVPPPAPFVEGEDGAEAVGAGYRFIAPATATEPLVMEAADGSVFLWTPTELCYRDEHGNIDYIAGSAPVQLEVRGREARYRRTFPASDEVHIAQPEGRKYWLILYEPPRPPASYLQGETWFGVSGMVRGVRLPPGIHTNMEAAPFTFPGPFAADLMDAQTDCWYEVADTADGGQMLFIWCRAEWLLDTDRVYPVKLDPTIMTSTSSTDRLVQFPDGTLMYFNTTATRYSTDGGQTWLPGTVIAHQSGLKFLDVDSSGRLWSVCRNSSTSNDVLQVHEKASNGTLTLLASIEITGGYTVQGLAAISSTSAKLVAVRYAPGSDIDHVYTIGATRAGSTIALSHTERESAANATTRIAISDSNRGTYIYSRQKYLTSSKRARYAKFEETTYTDWDYIDVAQDIVGLHGAANDWFLHPAGKQLIRGSWAASEQRYLAVPDVPNVVAAVYVPTEDMIAVVGTMSDGRLCMRAYYISTGTWSDLAVFGQAVAFNRIVVPQRVRYGSKVPVIFRSGANENTVMFEYLAFNTAPQAPTNLNRPPFDATGSALFTWQHNDPDGDAQAKYQLQIVLDSTTVYDSGEVQTSYGQHLLPGGTLQNGQTYQWRVRTADQAGEWSPWSDYAVFQTGPKPVATILYPTSDTTISTAEVTVQWSVGDQSSATVRLYDPTGQTVLQEHEVTTPSARAKTITGLENNQSYQVSVQVTSAIGVQGDEVFSGPFSVQFTQPPKPTASATGQEGFIRISITNSAPTGDQPVVASNELWRREPGKDWVRVAAGIAPDGIYDDYATASAVIYEYRVRAIGANGTYSDSDVVAASLTITGGIWLHDPRDPENTAHHFMYHELPSIDRPSIPSGTFQFTGRRYPVVQMDASQMERTVRYRLYLSDETDDRTALEVLYERRTTLCLRNHRGKKYYVVFTEMPLEFERRGAWADVEFQVVDFDEEV